MDEVIGEYRNVEMKKMEVEGVEGKWLLVEEEGVKVYEEMVYVENREKIDEEERKKI